MRLLHSLWTPPGADDGGRFHWLTPRHFLLGQALSATQAVKLYGGIDLVTDSAGARLLVDKLQLPYRSVHVLLDHAPVAPGWWAWGKLAAYKWAAEGGEPFIHLDGDVFLWDRLPAAVESAPLVCQSFEAADRGYENFGAIYDQPRAYFAQLPSLPAWWHHGDDRVAVNAGILGGSSLAVLADYATEAMQLIRRRAIGGGWDNVFAEQQVAYCVAKHHGTTWTPLLEYLRAEQTTYTHVMGAKRDAGYLARMEARAQRECPEHVEAINRLCGNSCAAGAAVMRGEPSAPASAESPWAPLYRWASETTRERALADLDAVAAVMPGQRRQQLAELMQQRPPAIDPAEERTAWVRWAHNVVRARLKLPALA